MIGFPNTSSLNPISRFAGAGRLHVYVIAAQCDDSISASPGYISPSRYETDRVENFGILPYCSKPIYPHVFNTIGKGTGKHPTCPFFLSIMMFPDNAINNPRINQGGLSIESYSFFDNELVSEREIN
jgi:hypothetical protein